MIWSPLLERLGLPEETVLTPALPGFQSPPPPGFKQTKDDYADWAVHIVKARFERAGPVDIVGHDWGALITHRVAMLVPEMIRSWVISGAVVSPDYRGHSVARIWNTPILGELLMRLTSPKKLRDALLEQGVPEAIADEEATHWAKRHMRQSILRLYRSANGLRFQKDWCLGLNKTTKPALLIWGEHDPYVPVSIAQSFAEQHGYPIEIIRDAGHFVQSEKPGEYAALLSKFWQQL